jgi:hypothetical protein
VDYAERDILIIRSRRTCSIKLISDIAPIARTLGNILEGPPIHHGALTVVPVLGPMLTEPE